MLRELVLARVRRVSSDLDIEAIIQNISVSMHIR
jgi:hypothetical protein